MGSRSGTCDGGGLVDGDVDALVRAASERMGPHLGLDPEDVVQDSLARVLARPANRNQDRSVLLRRLRVVTELRIRHEARRRRPEASSHDCAVAAPVSSSEDSSSRDVADRLRRELARLQPEHHWVLVLRDWLGAPWEAVSLVLDRGSPSASNALHHRARGALASRLRRELPVRSGQDGRCS